MLTQTRSADRLLFNNAIEVHVFDFNEDLYGEEVTIYFIKKLRQEKKFGSADALIAQITKDIAEAKAVLALHPDCIDLGI